MLHVNFAKGLGAQVLRFRKLVGDTIPMGGKAEMDAIRTTERQILKGYVVRGDVGFAARKNARAPFVFTQAQAGAGRGGGRSRAAGCAAWTRLHTPKRL